MNVEYTTSTALLLFLGAITLTIAFIVAAKSYFKNLGSKTLLEKTGSAPMHYSATARTKYPSLNIFALHDTFLAYGMMVAIGLMIVAFGWTTYEKPFDENAFIIGVADEIEMETPRTVDPPPPPPPPPATPVLQIVESQLDIETVEFESMDIDEETAVEGKAAAPARETGPPPPPPPPPKPEETSKEIFKVVEEKPTFQGCEDIVNKQEREACADAKLMAFIYENITYPSVARENNVSGTVVLQFVVEPDGTVSNVSVVRDVGAGCGEEAMRVVKIMPPWNPGKQRGRPVRVMFTLPVKFKLA